MLETILQSLRDVDGVQGAMIIDHAAAVIAHRTHSIYDLALVQQLARSIMKAADAVQLLQDDWDVMTTHFGEGKLVLRSLRIAGAKPRRYVLAVIADQTLNVAFLGVALRVAGAKLAAELETAPASPAPTAPTAPPAPSAVLPVAPTSNVSGRIPFAPTNNVSGRIPVLPASPELAQTGLHWTGAGSTSTVDGSDVAVLDSASSTYLTACTRALATSIGPMAKVYVRDAVRRVCAGRAFSRADGPALLAQLSSMLDSEDRAVFARATRAL